MSPARRSLVRPPFAAFVCLLLAAACSLSPHPDLPGAENDLGAVPGAGGALGAGGAPYTSGGAATGGASCEDPSLEPPACDAQGGQGGSDGSAGGGGR